jgi:pSer/pThr/pTyr-binding forkhead associated (FHA) protein
MPKFTIMRDSIVIKEITLSQDLITIGRRHDNDIVIEAQTISGEHAAIVQLNNDAYIEDLNSTNGTQVNGQPVKKHFLQDGDVIELVNYSIKYNANA